MKTKQSGGWGLGVGVYICSLASTDASQAEKECQLISLALSDDRSCPELQMFVVAGKQGMDFTRSVGYFERCLASFFFFFFPN